MGKNQVYVFRIIMWRDMQEAKKNLPLALYIPYNMASQGIYSALLTAFKTLKVYNPHDEKGRFVIEQECKTRAEAEEHRERVEGFLFGSSDEFKKNPAVKKVWGVRGLKKAMEKLGKKIKDGTQTLNLLNKFSIHLSWDIEERFI